MRATLTDVEVVSLGEAVPDLDDRPGISQSVVQPDIPDRVDADCLVVTDRALLESRPAGVGPVVLYADLSPDLVDFDEVDGFARPPDVDTLAFQIRLAVTRERSSESRHIERLHEGTNSLLETRTRADLFERTVDIAQHILEFDTCYVSVVEDGQFVLAAGTGVDDPSPVSVDHGLMGKTYHRGESELVDDVEVHPDTEPLSDQYRSAISVPVGDVGVFQAISGEPEAFDEHDLRRAELLVASVEGTLARIRSEERLQERSTAIERLHEGTVTLASVRSLDALWEHTIDIATGILDFDTCYVGVVDGETIVPQAVSPGAPPDAAREMGIEQGLAGKTLSTGVSHVVDVVGDESDPARDDYRSGISVPIGEVGVLQAVSHEESRFTDEDRELAELLVAHVAETHSRIRAEERLDDRRKQVTRLYEGTVGLVTLRSPDDLYERTVEIAEEVLDFDICYVCVVDGDVMVPRAASSHPTEWGLETIGLDHGVAGRTLQTGEALLVENVWEDAAADPVHGKYGSALSVPLGEFGVFQAVSKDPESFDEDDLALAELLMAYVTETLTRIHAENGLEARRETIESLHASTAEIVRCRTETELFERTIEAAADVLAFDTSHVFRVRDGQFVPVAASLHPDHEAIDSLPLDHGTLGMSYDTGESFLHTDVESSPDTDPVQPGFGSGITVPIGEYGVFQAVSSAGGTFTRTDLEFAELLVGHVTATVGRVEAEDELRSERDRLSALFENVPDAAISYEIVDGKPIVRQVNSAFENVFGYGPEEIVGENIDEYVVSGREDVGAIEANRRLERGENFRIQCTRQTATGPREFLLHIVPLELGQYNAAGYAIYTDITDRIRREDELERQNERLEEFAHIVSHDLRNPLSIARGHLELAREAGSEESFEAVERAHDRMGRLIENLLELARAGQVIGETHRLDLGSVVEAAWHGVDTDGATLVADLSMTVDGDEARLLGLFENLFRNSVEHGSTGSRAGPDDAVEHGSTVTVTVEETGTGFAVSDDGPGIDPEDREHVFEPGVTTGTDGIGYGLPTVRRVVEAHGWRITVGESEAGGARFDVHLDGHTGV